MCVNNLPRDAFDSGVAGIRTRDLLIATSQVQHPTATPSEVIYGNKIILSPNVPYVYWATFYTFYKPTVDYYMKFNTMRHVYKQSKKPDTCSDFLAQRRQNCFNDDNIGIRGIEMFQRRTQTEILIDMIS